MSEDLQSELAQAEARAKYYENQCDYLVRLLPNPTFVIDPESDRYVEVSKGYCELLGYREDELCSTIRPTDIHPDELDQLQEFGEKVHRNGFAATEKLTLCFSCKARSLCPSCDAKRAAAFAAFLQEELLEDVGHAVWTFSIPKMLRPYFLFNRELLTELARAGYELMVAAVDDSNARVGMVASIQTFSDNLKWNPHLHCVVSRGVWLAGGEWIPVPYIDTHAAEILFREKVFRLLQQHDLLSDERIKILRSWRHSGFNIDNDVYLYPSDTQAIETLSRYIVRCPVSLQRLHYDKKSNYVIYHPKSKKGPPQNLWVEPSAIAPTADHGARRRAE